MSDEQHDYLTTLRAGLDESPASRIGRMLIDRAFSVNTPLAFIIAKNYVERAQ